MRTIILLITFLFFRIYTGFSQSSGSYHGDTKLKVYMEGDLVDEKYIQRNINFVDFVVDPGVAELHIISNSHNTGGGGKRYNISFYTDGEKSGEKILLSCVKNSGDTEDLVRQRIVRTISIGLLQYINETRLADHISIVGNLNGKDSIQPYKSSGDNWNFWVFTVETEGGFDIEESKKSFEYALGLQADRVTEKWRIRNNMDYQNETRKYFQDDRIITSINYEEEVQSKIVYSLSNHWSSGLFLRWNRDTYLNTKNAFRLKPVLEYNVFPWPEADNRVFTLSCSIGAVYNDYIDTTIFDKLHEYLWEQSFDVGIDLVQPWGGVETDLNFSSYVPGIKNYSVAVETQLNFRITRGLMLTFEFSAEGIHNQMYLPREDVSLEDLLLNTRKLPTTYQLTGSLGLAYSFGSIYNNVVNERL